MITHITTLHQHLLRLSPDTHLIVAIDGRAGSGKSTLAKYLASTFDEAYTVCTDDFYVPRSDRVDPEQTSSSAIGLDYDWDRLESQVLRPLSQRHPARYQRYDWREDILAEWHMIPPGHCVVVEGVYSMQKRFASYYNFTIWVETPRSLRFSRGLARDGDGPEARYMWEKVWMPREDNYVAREHPEARADLVIDGSNPAFWTHHNPLPPESRHDD